MAAIRTRALERTFEDGTRAVAGVDLAVSTGTVFGFLGPNGAGKTTMVRMLTTLLTPTAGTAEVAGHDVVHAADRVRAAIGVALQEAGLDDRATGRELLRLQARLQGLSPRYARLRATEMLGLVGLEDAAQRRVGDYSGGMRRRLDLASALVHGPRVLFLDEPTTGLDPVSRQAVWDEIDRLNREDGITVFLTTQYLEEADRLADRVAIINRGTIVLEGTPADLKAQVGSDVITVGVPADERDWAVRALAGLRSVRGVGSHSEGLTIFADDGAASVAPVLRRLDAVGVTVRATAVAGPTLDDVFLHATGHRLEQDDAHEADDEEVEVR
jgi:ABC-2 type transport system ATP-binding protein